MNTMSLYSGRLAAVLGGLCLGIGGSQLLVGNLFAGGVFALVGVAWLCLYAALAAGYRKFQDQLRNSK